MRDVSLNVSFFIVLSPLFQFGGNPVSMSIALSVLNVIEEEHLIENAEKVGKYLLGELKKLQLKFPIIGDVR